MFERLSALPTEPTWYAGIGSRETPPLVLNLMTEIARAMSGAGMTLLSGGAGGADTAFETGATSKLIILPWAGFRGRKADGRQYILPTADADAIAADVWNRHAALTGIAGWDRLKPTTRTLMARNTYQVLGPRLDRRAAVLICWTPDGCTHWEARTKETGGTGQAIALASLVGVPVFNLNNISDRVALLDTLGLSDKKPEPQPIHGFDGEYRFLSNFHPAVVAYDGVTYPTVEHAYQAAKTLDRDERLQFLQDTAGQAKRRGRTVTLRKDWEDVKEHVMLELLEAKFAQDPLRAQLLATGDRYLEETNDWGDRYWGVSGGVGENRLGHLLMQVRRGLKGAIGYVHVSQRQEGDLYCGRGKNGTIPERPFEFGWLGNPCTIGKRCPQCGQVHTAAGSTLPCFEAYLRRRLAYESGFQSAFLTAVSNARRLACFCPTQDTCHTSVITRVYHELKQKQS